MKENITLRLETDLIKFLKKRAEEDIRSVNNYVEMVLTKHKQEIEKKEKPSK